MKSFKEFLKGIGDSSASLPSDEAQKLVEAKQAAISSISALAYQHNLTSGWSSMLSSSSRDLAKANKFAEQATEIVSDEAFLDELSDRIGKPLVEESEDEFVERSSSIMRKILYRRLGVQEKL